MKASHSELVSESVIKNRWFEILNIDAEINSAWQQNFQPDTSFRTQAVCCSPFVSESAFLTQYRCWNKFSMTCGVSAKHVIPNSVSESVIKNRRFWICLPLPKSCEPWNLNRFYARIFHYEQTVLFSWKFRISWFFGKKSKGNQVRILSEPVTVKAERLFAGKSCSWKNPANPLEKRKIREGDRRGIF